MENSVIMVDTPPLPSNRRHAGLVKFLGRQASLRFDDLDFTHPILAGSTMAELREAMDELARMANDDLSATYAHWMGSADTMSIGADASTDWMTLTKLRYSRFMSRNQIAGRAAFIWSPADIWLIHYFQTDNAVTRKFYYAFQSVISKEPAQYFVDIRPGGRRLGTGAHDRVTISTTERRFPPRRAIAGILNEVLGTQMESFDRKPILSSDIDHPLHQYILQTLRQ
jgi:hypothetical protein